MSQKVLHQDLGNATLVDLDRNGKLQPFSLVVIFGTQHTPGRDRKETDVGKGIPFRRDSGTGGRGRSRSNTRPTSPGSLRVSEFFSSVLTGKSSVTTQVRTDVLQGINLPPPPPNFSPTPYTPTFKTRTWRSNNEQFRPFILYKGNC